MTSPQSRSAGGRAAPVGAGYKQSRNCPDPRKSMLGDTPLHLAEPRGLRQSVQAAKTKHHRPGPGNNRNLFSPSSGGCKSKIKVLAGLVSSEGSFLGV